MCARKPHQSGITLVELIVVIVIIGVGLAGILVVMNTVVRNSADPMVYKQSVAMADALLDEILAKAYADPDGSTGETTRATMDDVLDYAYFDGSSAARKVLGSQLLGGSVSPLPDTFAATVAIATVSVGGQFLRAVTVSVTNPQGQTFVHTGYRGAY